MEVQETVVAILVQMEKKILQMVHSVLRANDTKPFTCQTLFNTCYWNGGDFSIFLFKGNEILAVTGHFGCQKRQPIDALTKENLKAMQK